MALAWHSTALPDLTVPDFIFQTTIDHGNTLDFKCKENRTIAASKDPDADNLFNILCYNGVLERDQLWPESQEVIFDRKHACGRGLKGWFVVVDDFRYCRKRKSFGILMVVLKKRIFSNKGWLRATIIESAKTVYITLQDILCKMVAHNRPGPCFTLKVTLQELFL